MSEQRIKITSKGLLESTLKGILFLPATTTNSLHIEDGSLPENYNPGMPLWKQKRLCAFCGEIIVPRIPPEGKKRFCNQSCSAKWRMSQKEIVNQISEKKRRPKRKRNCEYCGKIFEIGPGQTYKRFCSQTCSSKARGTDHLHTEYVRRKRGLQISKWWAKGTPEVEARKELLREMGRNATQESIEKMRKSLSGKTFLSRGGNSKLTKPQMELSRILNHAPMEYAIKTAPVKHLFQSLPNCYKVDIAIPEKMIVIEVDGNTHKQKKWKFLDKRKTEVLNNLGWKVLRFWNQDILNWISSGMKTESYISTILAQHGILPIL